MRRLLVPALFIAMLALPSRAMAWDDPALWFASASGAAPGGGGIIGTGGIVDHAIACNACHVGAPDHIGAGLVLSPPIVANAYTPGQRYQVSATLSGEHLGLSGCASGVSNANGFAASFEHAAGGVAGSLASDGNTSAASCQPTVDTKALTGTTVVYGDCRSVEGFGAGLVAWSFSWTAPPPGSGPVYIRYGAVDGNCNGSSLGDDVSIGVLYMGEAHAARSAVRGDDWAVAWLGLLPIVATATRWRRRARRRG